MISKLKLKIAGQTNVSMHKGPIYKWAKVHPEPCTRLIFGTKNLKSRSPLWRFHKVLNGVGIINSSTIRRKSFNSVCQVVLQNMTPAFKEVAMQIATLVWRFTLIFVRYYLHVICLSHSTHIHRDTQTQSPQYSATLSRME